MTTAVQAGRQRPEAKSGPPAEAAFRARREEADRLVDLQQLGRSQAVVDEKHPGGTRATGDLGFAERMVLRHDMNHGQRDMARGKPRAESCLRHEEPLFVGMLGPLENRLSPGPYAEAPRLSAGRWRPDRPGRAPSRRRR